MSFSSYVELDYGAEKKTSTTSIGNLSLGTRGTTPDGRVFRYSLAGEAIGAGKLAQDPLAVANEDMDLAVQAAGAVGDTSVSVTTGGAVAVDLYAEGYLYINDDAGEGHMYRVKGNTVTSGSATMTVTLAAGETVAVALTTSSLAGLKKNPYNGALLYNTTPDGIARGVAPTDVANAEYFWSQTWGEAAVWVQGTVVLGQAVVPSTNTSGAVDAHVGTGDDNANVGVVCSPISVTTDYGHIFLTIAP